MALTHWVEDWGSTLGTAGLASFGSYTAPGWNPGNHFEPEDSYIRTPNTKYGTMGLLSTMSLASIGTLTGSQYHVGSATDLILGDYSVLYTKLAEANGTGLWLNAGMWDSGRLVRFLLKPETGSVWAAGTVFTDFVGEGRNRSFEVWTQYLGDGTWQGTITDSEPQTSVLTYAAGAEYTPESLPALAIGAYTAAAVLRVLSSSWEYNAAVVPETILRFIGTWATGCGTYEWGGDVLGYPGDVQDRAYGPDDTAGWASTVGVTIDNSAGQWGSFAGTGQLPFEGLWNLRQYWSGIGTGTAIGSWVDLFTGYLEPDGVSFDYGRSQVRLTLQSTIARAAQTVARMNGTISAPCEQELVGTVTYADADTGTVRIGNHDGHYWEIENGCALWGTTGTLTPSVKIGSSITPAGEFTYGGTGTIVVDGDFPPWLTVGAPVWATLPWPSYVDRRNPSVMVSTLVNSLGLTWPIDNSLVYHKQQSFSSIAPNDRLYGGEKLTTALSGIMKAVNGFYSVDPTGQFRAFCLIPRFSVAGTVDFNAAFDSDWQMTYEPAYSQVEVDCSYNVEAGSFTEHVSVGGTQAWGEVKKYELKCLGSGIEAQSMAGRLYRNAYLPRPSLTLRLAGSSWADYQPGNVYAIHNLPAQLGAVLAGTNMICYSRTYSWADDLTAMEFVALPGGNYAVWDGTPADYWEGSGKVWY